MATEVKHQLIFPAAPKQIVTELYLSSTRQPKLMVNGSMSNDLVHLVPDDRDRQKQLCYDDSKNPAKLLPLPSMLTAGAALKSDLYRTASKSKSSASNATTTNRDERSTIGSSAEGKSANDSASDNPVASPHPPRDMRSQSTSGTSARRTIFGSFWKKGDNATSDSVVSEGDSDSQSGSSTKSASQNGRARSSSFAVPESPVSASHRKSRRLSFDSNSNRDGNVDIMRFSPPVEYRSVLRSRFEDLHQLPKELQKVLPPLPSPLSRICHRDGSLSSGGMYPLTSPRSILQKSSYGTLTLEQQKTEQLPSFQGGDFHKSTTGSSQAQKMIMSIPLSLTDSIHHNTRQLADKSQARKTSILEDIMAADDTSSSSSTNRRVQFDPRVTISEYDDHVARQWYPDSDLDGFKFETIALAQRYLLKHPDMAAEYCLGRLDPVTGCIRKKPLYSLSILNSVAGNSDNDDDSTSASQATGSPRVATPSYDYAERASMHVQKILIVDPNTLILDLFRKSLLQIFPHAELTTVQTGEEALYHMKRAWSQSKPTMSPRAFDIVIMEERLRGFGQSPGQVRTIFKTEYSSMKDMADGKMGNTATPSATVVAGSELFQPKFVSGSEVITKLKQLEDDFCRPDRCILEDDELEDPIDQSDGTDLGSPLCWRSLIVGVCVDQKHDALRLWQNGCDVVWPKPPPPMGENFRNQLVSLLVKKRNQLSVPTGYHQQLSM